MLQKHRNLKSVFQNNLGSSDKEVNADHLLPKSIWGVDNYIKQPSKLKDLADKQIALNKVKNSIELEKETYSREVKKLNVKSKEKIALFKSDLDKEKFIKSTEFKDRRREIESNKNKELLETLNKLSNNKKERLEQFKQEYQNDLLRINEANNKIEDIFSKYKVKITEYIEPYDGDWDEVTIDDIENVIYKIESLMEETINNGMIINKAVDKVKGFNSKQNLALGAGVLATGLFAAPIALMTAGVTVGLTISENKKMTEKLSEYFVRLVQLQDIVKYLYHKRVNNNSIDVSDIDNQMTLISVNIEEQSKRELMQLEEEEKAWEEEYKIRKNSNFEEKENEKLKESVEKMKNTYESKRETLELVLQNSIKALEDSKGEVLKRNKIREIKNEDNFALFDAVKKAKELNSDFLKYKTLKKLNFKKREEFLAKYGDDLPENLKKQIDYDEELFSNDYLPLKKNIETYERNGINEEVAKKMLVNALEKETPLYVLDMNKIHLGRSTKSDKYINLDSSEEVFSEDWNNNSLLLVYKNEEEEKVLINYVKYLIFQCMSQQTPQALEVNICNPTLDSKFNDILINTTTIKDGKEVKNPLYCTNYSGAELTHLINEQTSVVNNRYKKELVGDKTLTDVIKEKRKLGSKVPKYIINVIHRYDINCPLLGLNENSSVHGIINIALLPYQSLVEKKKDNDNVKEIEEVNKNIINKFIKDKIIIQIASILSDTESVINIYTKGNNKYKQVVYRNMSSDEINDYTNFFEDRYKRSLKLNSITRINEFIDQLVGDNLWTGDTLKTLKLYFGYVDGDKSKPMPVVIDEENKVHAFMGGTTGGGKSVTLAFITNVLKAIYPPSELEIYYYDFKKVEVENHINPYKWPNASAMSASATGDYLISLINNVVDEMNQRNDDMKLLGCAKLSEYRKKLKQIKEDFIAKGELEKAKKVKIPPRTLIIIDEVQQGFTISDDVSEQFKECIEKISRLARSAGLHLFFVSQDPGNKIPSNVMDLFTIRACTKASPSVSDSVLRNKFSALPENQFIGFLGVNTSPTGEDSENIQYVVPLTEPEDTRLYTKIASDMADNAEDEANRSKDAVIFDDRTKYSFNKLENYLEEHELGKSEFILGDIVKFQKEYEPAKIQLNMGPMQGFTFVSTEENYKKDFFETIMNSINKNKYKSVVFFGGDVDEGYKVDELVKYPFTKKIGWTNVNTGIEIDGYSETIEISNEIGKENKEKAEIKNNISNLESKINNFKLNKDGWMKINPDKDYEAELENIKKELDRCNSSLEDLEKNSLQNKYKKYEKERKYFHAPHYGKEPRYGSKEPDMTMSSIIKSLLERQVNVAKELRKDGKSSDPVFIIAIDPERDPYVVQDNIWKNKDFKRVISDGSSYGVYLITITSNFDRIAESEINRYVLGISPGPDAAYNKAFKHMDEGLAQMSNNIDPTKNFKVKLPTHHLVSLMPWER